MDGSGLPAVEEEVLGHADQPLLDRVVEGSLVERCERAARSAVLAVAYRSHHGLSREVLVPFVEAECERIRHRRRATLRPPVESETPSVQDVLQDGILPRELMMVDDHEGLPERGRELLDEA